jgi:hypothetical protein
MNNIKKTIVINSNLYDNKTDFVFQLPQTIKITKYLQLVYASIPNTNYLITGDTNELVVAFSDGYNMLPTLTPKNYDVDTLSTEIKSKVNYAMFDIVFDKAKLKYQLTASQSFNVTGSMCKILGIEQNQLFNNLNIYAKDSINFNMPQILYILVNEILNPNVICNTSKSSTFIIHNNVLKSNNIIYFSYMYDNIVNVDYPIELNQLHIKILDENYQTYNNLNIPIQIIMHYI